MIKEYEIEIRGHRTNFDHFRSLGYSIQYRKPILVKVTDLMPGSTSVVTSICDNCLSEKKNEFRFYYDYTNGLKSKYFCNKCNKIKRKETCLEKWGVENPMQSDVVKERLKKSLFEKYGVEHYSKTKEYSEKYKQTCQEKWGVENIFQSEPHKNKIKNTNKKRFGVEYPQQNKEVKKKTTESFLRNYGVERYSQTHEFIDKVKFTSQEKWGVDNFSQTNEFRYKSRKTSFEKWGVNHYSKTQDFKDSLKNSREKLTKLRYDELIGDDYYVIDYISSNFKIHHKFCGKDFDINRDQLYQRHNLNICICTKCLDINLGQSNMELEIQDFLNTLGVSYNIKDRKLLNGKELDIYLPDYNLAIECNGVYWHSEIYMDKYYHRDKTLDCRKMGIDLLHVWEDDWKYKREIIKSIIRNKTNCINNRIFARKCTIEYVNSKDSVHFLNENHIQGHSPSQLKVGLYFNKELVSLMTFGYRYTNGKKEFELIRFCNKVNYNVIGSASKLFSYFTNNTDIERIISYSDISLFSGGLYDKLGFEKVRLSSPNYFWVVDGVRKHRFNFNKKRLVKMGNDPNKSESEILHDKGYYRVFSCGQEKWVYHI